MKCKFCGKHFNTVAFGETHCPYCGAKVEKETEKKILNREYRSNRYWLVGVIALPVAIIILMWIVYQIFG